jgi:hypothetical protein
MSRRILAFMALIIGGAFVVYGQEGQSAGRAPSLKVTAATVADKFIRTPKTLFEVGADICVEVAVINTSDEDEYIGWGSPWREYRLELLKSGEVVPFKKSVQEFLTPSPDRPFSGSFAVFTLKPGDSFPAIINLTEWYEPLAPGHYQLTVGRIWVREFTAKPIEFDIYP